MRSLSLDEVEVRRGASGLLLECHGRFPDPARGLVTAARISYNPPKGLIVRSDSGRTRPSERLAVEASGADFIRALEHGWEGLSRLSAAHGKPVSLRVWNLAVFGGRPPLAPTKPFDLRGHASARGIDGGFDFFMADGGTPRVFAQPGFAHLEPAPPGSPVGTYEFHWRGAPNRNPVASSAGNVKALSAMINDKAARTSAAAINGALVAMAPDLIALGRKLIATLCA